jgi:alpha-tubulin suppressor-like RCC1 family protein
MSEIIKKIKELNELKENILSKIKCLYVFKDYYKNDKNVLIVTNDDNVFALGDNNCGVLGFGNDREVKEITINENLSHKQIVDFKNGWKHVIGRTVDGKVYCWGNNGIFGVLGNGKNDLEICKPELNEYLNDKQIIDICCGFNHSLVLTNSGELYAWGGNWFGQIGNENYDNQSIPIKVNGFNDEKIVMISCGEWHSMALTESGHVFSWGLNSSGQMGLENTNKANKPSIVSLSIKIPIKKISCGREHSLLLSRDGDIYWFGNNGCETKISPKKLTINSNKFIDIASHNEYYISIALSLNGIYYIWGNCGEKVIKIPKETEFKSFNDIFVEYFQITYKTLNKTSKYKLEFKELELIGIGGFGKVYKVLDSLDGKQYAMKIISTEGILKFSINKLKASIKYSERKFVKI